MCLDMCMCVVRQTRSVCKFCASGVQRVQVGCCIVQPHVAHSPPIFLSVAVVHGRPWIHNSNSSNNYYNSYKQVGAGVVVERQVELSSRPVQASGSGSQGRGSQASTSSGLTTQKKPQVDEPGSNSLTEQTTPPRLQSHFPYKNELLVHHSCHMDAPLADDSLGWRWLRDVTPKYLYRRALCQWLKMCRQVDPSGIITYPWQGSALTATRWSDWKILRIGLQGYA